jgi:hypothetical protein
MPVAPHSFLCHFQPCTYPSTTCCRYHGAIRTPAYVSTAVLLGCLQLLLHRIALVAPDGVPVAVMTVWHTTFQVTCMHGNELPVMTVAWLGSQHNA